MIVLKVSILTMAIALRLVQGDLTTPETNQWYAILSISSGKALDVRANFTAIHPFKYLGTQIYQFKTVNGGSSLETEYQIAEHDNDMVISLDEDDIKVVLKLANNSDSRQIWYVKKKRPADVVIINKKTGWCLDVFKDWNHEGNKVTTWKCANYPYNQYWALLKLC